MMSYDSVPSPECLVRSEPSDAAIEVKRLTGDSVFQAYMEALQVLRALLGPSCGGFYWLGPAVDFRLPIDGVN